MKIRIKGYIPIVISLLSISFCANAQILALDKSTLVELNEDRTHFQTETYQFISNSAGKISVAIPVALLLAGEIKGDKELSRKALYIGESIVVSSVITWGLKYSINRDRPATKFPGQITPMSNGGSPSFPSGHTSQAFSTATALFIAWPKWYVAVPAFGWATTVGYSRMYLGVHYPSDVLAGALVGAGSAWLTYKANYWLHARHKAKRLDISLH